MPLTDDEIAALGPAERIELVRRLKVGGVVEALVRTELRRARRRRAIALTITAVCTALLLPWVVYLAVTLPDQYVAQAWALTWTGFDVLLVIMLGLTAFFAWKRRVLVVLTSFATGVLLLADAWFDITTADPDDVRLSIVSAIVVEIPLAAFLMFVGVSIVWRIARLLNVMTGHGDARSGWRSTINSEIVHSDRDPTTSSRELQDQ
ncbi:hypothetical protein HJ588_01905 [Flexivirga sp. ID2601S]|uniref:Uncharacterized protein n=1 Tax=Flexivirga aerilata TaxID=1656889 RepID=A0A849AFL0_9MICO|nr:hypothetical protein [Flexivirga aerilata]NNG38031.1 hypothetical protein [Flexivirga aerilata]